MNCNYIFRKGKLKGQTCNQLDCTVHKGNNNKLLKNSSPFTLPPEQSQQIIINIPIPKTPEENNQLIQLIDNKDDIEKSIKKRITSEDSVKQKILDLDTSIENKTVIMKHFLNVKKLDVNSTEHYKTQLYIDQSLLIPWGKLYKIRDKIGIQSETSTLVEHLRDRLLIHNFIEEIKKRFDKEIYGMENIKNEIINYICKFITNPHSQKNIIALYGSAGVCKTKFVTVLSKVLNIPIKIISLGGMKDSSYLLGHSQTYQDSKCGTIIQSIIDSKVMNPILYFDELDKVSNGEYGQDIYAVLSNLTDPTFNDISKINKVLLDRLNIIYIENPSRKEKVIILKNYCLKDILENIGIIVDIQFDDACYHTVIDYTDKQIDLKVSSGIRESIRILEKILLEINKELLLEQFNAENNVIHYDLFITYFTKLKNQFVFIESNDNSPPPNMYI